MRKSKTVLGDICKITMGQSPDSSTYNTTNIGLPFYQGNADFGELYPKTRIWCSEPQKIAEPENILLSVRAPIGALNIAKEKCCIGRGLAAITPHKNFCFNKYLFYILKYKYNELNARGTGSTFKAINKSILNNLPIDIYSIDRQKRIAGILDKATELIALRKQQIQKLDLLVKSRFIEMFGDPVLNTKKFPVYRMDEVVKFIGGSQPDKKYFEYSPTPNNIRLIQIRDYKSDKFITYIPKFMAKRYCTANDIMIGRYGPPIFQILQGIEGAYNVALMKAVPLKGNKEFIRYFLKQDTLLHYLESLSSRTAGQDGIQMDKLKEYPFPFPPLANQEAFETFIQQIDKTKSTLQQSLEKLELNYKALMQTYFG